MFCFSESLSQFQTGIETIQEWPVPKWWVSIFIPYGFSEQRDLLRPHIWDRPARAQNDGTPA